MPTVLTSVRRRRQLRSPSHFRCRMTLSWTFDYLSDLILVLQGLNHDVMDRNWNHNRRWGIYMTLWIWVGNDVNVLTAAGLLGYTCHTSNLGWEAIIPRPLHSRPKRIPRSYPFSRKRGYFFNGRCEFAKARKRVILQAWVREILKKG